MRKLKLQRERVVEPVKRELRRHHTSKALSRRDLRNRYSRSKTKIPQPSPPPSASSRAASLDPSRPPPKSKPQTPARAPSQRPAPQRPHVPQPPRRTQQPHSQSRAPVGYRYRIVRETRETPPQHH